MARIDADDLPDPELVYLAGTLREARAVEALLTSRGLHYATEVEELGRSTLFGAVRHGVGFYVSAGQADYSRQALAEGRFRGVVHEDPAP